MPFRHTPPSFMLLSFLDAADCCCRAMLPAFRHYATRSYAAITATFRCCAMLRYCFRAMMPLILRLSASPFRRLLLMPRQRCRFACFSLRLMLDYAVVSPYVASRYASAYYIHVCYIPFDDAGLRRYFSLAFAAASQSISPLIFRFLASFRYIKMPPSLLACSPRSAADYATTLRFFTLR